MTCLLLNADYQPIRVITARSAVVLLVVEAAELLAESGEEYHSAGGLTVPVPSVLRLLSWVKIPLRARLPVTRRNVLARDKGICAYCKGSASTVDHVRPRSRGGPHRWENVVACCSPCNAKKDDRTLAELARICGPDRFRLDFVPWAPKGQLYLAVAEMSEPAWKPFLAHLATA